MSIQTFVTYYLNELNGRDDGYKILNCFCKPMIMNIYNRKILNILGYLVIKIEKSEYGKMAIGILVTTYDYLNIPIRKIYDIIELTIVAENTYFCCYDV